MTSSKNRTLVTITALNVALICFVIGVLQTSSSQPRKSTHVNVRAHVAPVNVRPHVQPVTVAPTATTTTLPPVGLASIVAPSVPTSTVSGTVAPSPSVATTTQAAPVPSVAPTTTTTAPPGSTVVDSAYINPTFVQDPTNPLIVTYSYSAGASVNVNGVNLALSDLPSGTLTLTADALTECTMNVGAQITGGSCKVTYSSFGVHNLDATYAAGSVIVSVGASDDVEPYATTTTATISGGGSLGGLEFDAAVTDSNGNPVTTGTVTMTIADVTQGWSYVVSGQVGQDGGHPDAFACAFIENYPRVGEYFGCGFSGSHQVSPALGDAMTISASYAGTLAYGNSTSAPTTYLLP